MTDKNVRYLPDQPYVGSNTTACLHANGTDWWFFKAKESTTLQYKMLIDDSGLHVVDSFDIGTIIDKNIAGGTQASFSPDGLLFATYDERTMLRLYDFDRETGDLSNYRIYDIPEIEPLISFGGLAFLPDSRFIYLSESTALWQYDLWIEGDPESPVLIDTFDGFYDIHPLLETKITKMQLRPDCKIYIGTGNGTKYLHVINRPNEKGVACNFSQHAVELPNSNDQGSMPNFPHFRMDEADICDPTITNIFGVPLDVTTPTKIIPNPAYSTISVEGFVGDIMIIDLLGKTVWSGSSHTGIDVSAWTPGVYYVKGANGNVASFVRIK
ncbi:MAG: T9SS type A sorting domain-containing protein [Saprospiraceae bacterium]